MGHKFTEKCGNFSFHFFFRLPVNLVRFRMVQNDHKLYQFSAHCVCVFVRFGGERIIISKNVSLISYYPSDKEICIHIFKQGQVKFIQLTSSLASSWAARVCLCEYTVIMWMAWARGEQIFKYPTHTMAAAASS